LSKITLETKIGKVRLRNPLLLTSGVLGTTGDSLKQIWDSGAGAVVTKSCSLRPSKGYSNPTVVQVPNGVINAMGLPHPGIEEMISEIKIAKEAGASVIGSIFGKEEGEFEAVASKMSSSGVDAIELNLSCPHVREVSSIGHDPELTRSVVKRVMEKIKVPLWVKLPGNTNLSNMVEVARAAEEAGADALTLTNTVPAMAIDAETERPILGHTTGGLSGPVIKPIALRLVYGVYEEVRIPIIGCGGVVTAEDAVEFLLAGASAVGIGTGILYRGLGIFGEICDGMRSFLQKKGLRTPGDLVGKAHVKR
jgi:dihydroorotate dehydrogenase (NAD+) catalytic subunit